MSECRKCNYYGDMIDECENLDLSLYERDKYFIRKSPGCVGFKELIDETTEEMIDN